jgi:hypothetical protein
MPPSNKKKQLNNIACDNKIKIITNINNNTINDNTVNNNSTNDNIINYNTVNDNTVHNNAGINKEKLIDNFFGIIIEKPPSPINISIDETQKINIQYNIDILDTQNNSIDKKLDNKLDNKPVLPKNIIYSNLELKKKIEILSENELCEIFKIIKNNKEKYSTNNNGIFINLSTLKKISIQEISNFLLFCENNNKILDKEEEQREIYRELLSEN